MYWENEQAMHDAFNQRGAIEALKQDESEFMSKISVCIVDEQQLIGPQASIKLILCSSGVYAGAVLSQFMHVLPHVKGVQQSSTQQLVTRPQLPPIDEIPQPFVGLWFEQYDHVLQDFQSSLWYTFYTLNFEKT